ncbi:GDP-mannose mannosyl hydrolase [Endozoicomonas sp. SCSIO W0465]|uniref:GDP-mannose mannosyl hydrolase n=1 Tax=Endozoicomonas sp. SCSIO W0465 TaxID=2918516 RepID=UPI002074F508|nr:GDP-mannose mannosyl hydrolase [Endozoicomonas sp. SCSIO W0465]USE35704.1 GDP-mannose mannosyl hydrolase [Endozoicomonas sp. SCSIO W0465]
MLPTETFKTIIASTPLVSIDLIVRNSQEQVLLGLRNNRPAKGYWFVPGGRIQKDERLEAAFQRLVKVELDTEAEFDKALFLGPYQHFYSDNFSGENFSTHYVVLGYELSLDIDLDTLPADQHQNYRWFTVDELLASEQVHQHTKDYFL